jgi:hypothetical protein
MKKISTLLFALSMAATVWAGELRHTDAVLGFEVKYPSDWKKTHPKKTNASLTELTSPDGSTRVIINPMPNPDNTPALVYLATLQQNMGVPKQAIKQRGELPANVLMAANAETGARAVSTFDVLNFATIFTAQKIAYMVIGEMPYKDSKQYSKKSVEEADKIINSFRIIRLP